MTTRSSDRSMPAWLPLPRRTRPPALSTPVDLRPAPVTATPGKAGSAVRAALQRVHDAAAAVEVPVQVATVPLQPDGAGDQGDPVATLHAALADLDREVARLLKATSQEVARARREQRDAVAAPDVRVSALRRPRRPGSPDA